MNLQLTEKVAIVTGSAMVIGRAVALRLVLEGADVAVADIDEKNAEQTAQQIRNMNRRALVCLLDLADVAQIQPMVAHVVSEFGRIDILVNAAAIVQNKPFLEVTEADWDRILDLNLKSVVFCIQAVAARMIEQIPEEVKKAGRSDRSYGKIVNFSSISGRRGRPLQAHYAASKAAIINVTQSAALAFAPYNINVNAVSPSVVPTLMWKKNVQEKSRIFGTDAEKESKEFIERIPLKRAGSPEDMAGAVAFLCSPDSNYITGQTLNVDGGFEMN